MKRLRKIYFIRHSIRDTNIKHEVEAPLTDDGYDLAELLVPIFESINITAIYSSPYNRAIETIVPIAESKKIDINIVTDLKERVIGTWVKDFDSFTKQQWDDFDYLIEDGESLNDVRHRMLRTFNTILSRSTGDIIVSGHGTSFAVLFNYFTPDFGYESWRNMTMPDVYCLTIYNDIFELKRTKLKGG